MNLSLSARFGPKVEIEALEFIGGAPVEWRFAGCEWRPGLKTGNDNLRGFHDLQNPVAGGTRGHLCAQGWLETRGIGDALVIVWLRDGTYLERAAGPELLQISEVGD
jgi:hypothetical protein